MQRNSMTATDAVAITKSDTTVLNLCGFYVGVTGDADTGLGRHMVPVTNELAGATYRYVRIYTTVAGAIASGINYSAFLAKR